MAEELVDQRRQEALETGLSDDEADRAIRYFNFYDTDGSGRIEEAELRSVLQLFGCDVSENSVRKMLQKADLDSDGTIDFKEYCNMVKTKWRLKDTRQEKLRKAFAAFDTDESGFLSREELKQALTSMGMDPISDEEIDDMLDLADVDGDGQLSVEEFVAALTKDVEDMIDEMED